uniref:Uncharacterized protein n=1 Tax=Anguilla anguilla TaxID=7936 RepID=A0A0E9PMG1_ANGAN
MSPNHSPRTARDQSCKFSPCLGSAQLEDPTKGH